MATLAVLNNILRYIDSFSLTDDNKKWLADKLIESKAVETPKHSKEDQEILDGFREAVLELKEIRAGRKKARSFDDFMAEVAQKEEEGYYD